MQHSRAAKRPSISSANGINEARPTCNEPTVAGLGGSQRLRHPPDDKQPRKEGERRHRRNGLRHTDQIGQCTREDGPPLRGTSRVLRFCPTESLSPHLLVGLQVSLFLSFS